MMCEGLAMLRKGGGKFCQGNASMAVRGLGEVQDRNGEVKRGLGNG